MEPDLDFPSSLAELFILREIDPARYERIMTDIAKRAFEAQEKLRAAETVEAGHGDST